MSDKILPFNPDCTACPRLSNFLKGIKSSHPDYYAKPVPPFGSVDPQLLIVGLAPGLHGANATGRPFTGDHAGIILYKTLHKFNFASRSVSEHVNDGLELINCRITNAVKCVPPANKPEAGEIATCNQYLKAELRAIKSESVILALGRIAHNAVLKSFSLKQSQYLFSHGNEHMLPGDLYLLDSYHCSRYNTQTGRLTEKMFHEIFYKIHQILNINT